MWHTLDGRRGRGMGEYKMGLYIIIKQVKEDKEWWYDRKAGPVTA